MLKLTKDSTIEELPPAEFNKEILLWGKKKYKPLRQNSKPVTFALQYGGTAATLVKNSGFPQKEAESIVSNYKTLYWVSEKDKEDHIQQATKDGYVLGAFGLKVRTPVIKQCILGSKVTPKEAEAEKRTATNARFQSYGLLNSRAAIEFNGEVRKSQYKYDIKPVAHIHDAQYFLIKDDIDTLLWANEHLVKAVSWQDDPVIYHPQVHLGGEFSMFFPDWAHEITVPNKCSSDELISIVKESVE